MEQTMSEQFTIEQLRELFRRGTKSQSDRRRDVGNVYFDLTVPSALLSTKTFVHLDSDLITVTVGQRPLPEASSNFDAAQLKLSSRKTEDRSSLIGDRSLGSYALEWIGIHQLASVVIIRLSTVASSNSTGISSPAVRLRSTRSSPVGFHFSFDYNEGKLVHRQASCSIPLCRSIDRLLTPEDPSRARPYNREYHLKQFWFDLFALDEHGILLPRTKTCSCTWHLFLILFTVSIEPWPLPNEHRCPPRKNNCRTSP